MLFEETPYGGIGEGPGRDLPSSKFDTILILQGWDPLGLARSSTRQL
jgi:hypothetical protein